MSAALLSSPRTSSGIPSTSPTWIRRISFSTRFERSAWRKRLRRSQRALISAVGLLQFSFGEGVQGQEGNAQLKAGAHNLPHGIGPSSCPKTRFRSLAFAQRPFPSMMMATWRGSAMGIEMKHSQISRISFSFSESKARRSFLYSHPLFRVSSWARNCSSSDMVFSFLRSLIISLTSRRMFRRALNSRVRLRTS